jgi:hypothetical protein
MTEKDDDKRRDDMIKELLGLGLSTEKATAIAKNVVLYDWLVFRTVVNLLGRAWDPEDSAEAVVKLVEMLHPRARASD